MNKHFFYAELDENNICKAVSMLSGLVSSSYMIQLEKYDESLLGQLYVDGEWQKIDYSADLIENLISTNK